MDYTGSIYRLIDRAEDEMKEYAQRVKQLSADEIYRHSAETAAKESLLSALIHDSYELDDDDLDLILKPKNPVEALYQFLTSDKTDLSSESSISSILSEYNAQCQERDLTLSIVMEISILRLAYHQLAASYLSQAPEDAALRPCGPVRTLCGPVRPQRRPCGNGPADRPAHGTGRGCQGCLGLKTATAVGADQRAAGNHGDLVPARRKERRRPVYRINREAEKNP